MKQEERKRHLERCRQVKAEFGWRGVCIGDWARQHGFAPQVVYDVLNGRVMGRRGEAHRVAVALGVKDGVAA